MLLAIIYLVLILPFAILAQEHVDRAPTSLVLKPLYKRSADEIDLSSLNLQEQESFLYGSPGDGDSYTVANMTMYTGDGELIISMERFAGMLKSVECGDNIVLVFNTEAAFQYAIHAWDWVNEQTNHSFLMISNHPACGPDSQRQPYYVYGVHYDELNFTVYLHAIKRSWSEVAHTFDLNIGQAGPPSELRPRQQQSNDNSVTWNLAGNFQHDLFTVNASGINVGVSCQSCGVTGSVVVGWSIIYENFIPQDIVFTVQPKKFLASVVLGLSLSGETVGPSFSKEVKLSVPIAGLQILDIANLGPTFDLAFGFSASAVSGALQMSYGLTAALADDAILTMDLLNPGKSKFSGWAPHVNQVPLDVSGEISASIEAYIQEALGISISVLGNGYEASLDMKLPDYSTTLKLVNDPNGGVCKNKQDTRGVDFNAQLGLNLFISVDRENGGGNLLSFPLYVRPFLSYCDHRGRG
ncbi:hypothetical protein GP486_000025 [Trichoglossum hirsutum]|uniref:Uncharacterized protein n=1 Tax=Trichoglossum hirsutum TaxID=265104 RepID=A0A9P8RTZ3_9PEZI|nr:hypothetical protein GP486_000025 [Trichoglossum hirsutum]